MRHTFFAMILCTVPLVASAGPSQEKIATLMEALGFLEMWTEQIEMGKEQNKQQGDQILEQILANLNPSDEFRERFSQAFNNYMEAIASPWSAEEIVSVWARFYGPNFSDDELDQLIAFYTSELGRKDVAVTKSSMVQFSEYFSREFQPVMEQATQAYIDELQTIAKECNCKRRAP